MPMERVVERVTMYKCSDGEVFKDRKEADFHERTIEFDKALQTFFGTMDTYEEAVKQEFIQHIIKNAKPFVAICKAHYRKEIIAK